MTKDDVVALLKGAGFYLKRQGSKHEIWANDGGQVIPIPRGRIIENRLGKKLRLDIRKASGVILRKNPKAESPQISTSQQFQEREMKKVQEREMKKVQEREMKKVQEREMKKEVVRYGEEVRARIRDRIVELRQAGHSNEKTATIMNMEGFRSPTGGEFTTLCVRGQLYQILRLNPHLTSALRTRRTPGGPPLESFPSVAPAAPPAAPQPVLIPPPAVPPAAPQPVLIPPAAPQSAPKAPVARPPEQNVESKALAEIVLATAMPDDSKVKMLEILIKQMK